MARGRLWVEVVTAATADTDAAEVRTSIRRDRRYGSGAWTRATAQELGMGNGLRYRGRPQSAGEGETP
jgi:hypothetical protein